MILAAMPVLTSCDDDEPYYSPLIGLWAVSSDCNVYHEFEFNADGTGYYYEFDRWGYDDYPAYEAPFFWYEDYDQVQLRFRDGAVWNYGYQFSGNRLLLYNLDSGDPYPMEYRFVGY